VSLLIFMARLAHFESEMKYEIVRNATLLSPSTEAVRQYFLSYAFHIQESNLGQPEMIAKPNSMAPKPFTNCHNSLKFLSMPSGTGATFAIYKSKVVRLMQKVVSF
jgi:hypothetical protein